MTSKKKGGASRSKKASDTIAPSAVEQESPVDGGAEETPVDAGATLRADIMAAFQPGERLTLDDIGARVDGWTTDSLMAAVRRLFAGSQLRRVATTGEDEPTIYELPDVVEASADVQPTAATAPVASDEEELLVCAMAECERKRGRADYTPQNRLLMCVLSEDEINEKRAEAGDHNLEANEAEHRAAEAKATLDAQKKRAEVAFRKCRELLDVAARGEETRPVECLEVLLSEHKLAVTLRTDTLEILERRPMRANELQGRLFDGEGPR